MFSSVHLSNTHFFESPSSLNRNRQKDQNHHQIRAAINTTPITTEKRDRAIMTGRFDMRGVYDRGERHDIEERFGRRDGFDREEDPLERDELPTEDELDMRRFRQQVGEQLLEVAALMRIVVNTLNQACDRIEALENNVERLGAAFTAIVASMRAGMEREAQGRG